MAASEMFANVNEASATVNLKPPKFLNRQHIADGHLNPPGLGPSEESPFTETPLGFRRAFSEPDRRATQCKTKRDQKTPQAEQGIGRKFGPWQNERQFARTVSIFSFLEARQDRNGAGREVTPNDESNATSS